MAHHDIREPCAGATFEKQHTPIVYMLLSRSSSAALYLLPLRRIVDSFARAPRVSRTSNLAITASSAPHAMVHRTSTTHLCHILVDNVALCATLVHMTSSTRMRGRSRYSRMREPQLPKRTAGHLTLRIELASQPREAWTRA